MNACHTNHVRLFHGRGLRWVLLLLLLLTVTFRGVASQRNAAVERRLLEFSLLNTTLANETSSVTSTSTTTTSASPPSSTSTTTSTASTHSTSSPCHYYDPNTKIPYNTTLYHHKRVYRVGVLGIRGLEAAYEEFNRTFVDYLTATAGQAFDPPLAFEMKALDFGTLFTDTAAAAVDFIYVNPSAFSCIESEFTAQSLVSQISRRKIHNKTYHLKMFGGVIMARRDNTAIQTIHDLKDKIVAAASISGLGSGQMQFLQMQEAGMSYINDPKQLVFTSDQGKVVTGVLKGQFDVGFVRTDQIERTTDDETGELVDPNVFQILDVQPNLTIDGVPFPFASSTPLYPEWNVAALHHVPPVVSRQVQQAMLALQAHAKVAKVHQECVDQYQLEHNITSDTATTTTNDTMDVVCPWDGIPQERCDTTREIAEIALDASNKGKFSAWQTTLSYMQLRSMQQVTGFIAKDPTDNVWKCTRSTTLYDSITCPEGYYKETEEEVAQGCDDYQCEEGYQCICSPCRVIVTCTTGVELVGNCVSYAIFLPSLLVPLFLVCAVLVHVYVEYRRKQADSVWAVDPTELEFEVPNQVIGVGTFGFVLLAEYRGTKVAVKKVLPPKKRTRTRPQPSRRSSSVKNANQHKSSHEDTTINVDDHIRRHQDNSNGGGGTGSTNQDVDIESHPQKSLLLTLPSSASPGLKSMGPVELQASMDSSMIRSKEFLNPGLRSMASRLKGAHTASLVNRRLTYEQLKADFVREVRHLAKVRSFVKEGRIECRTY